MSIDRQKFFDTVRKPLFSARLSQGQVANMGAILDEWEARQLTDLRWLACMLGTVRGECGAAMAPVREGFRKTDADARAYVLKQRYPYAKAVNGKVYYGRGLVQLTWEANYAAMGKIIGVDLAGDPDRALEPAIAAKVMFEGMIRGTFTRHKLADYFDADTTDFLHSRRIINGMDRAAEFAGFMKTFLKALA
jgi:hypothetical protein